MSFIARIERSFTSEVFEEERESFAVVDSVITNLAIESLDSRRDDELTLEPLAGRVEVNTGRKYSWTKEQKDLLEKCMGDEYYMMSSGRLNNKKIKECLEKKYPQAKKITTKQISSATNCIKQKHKKSNLNAHYLWTKEQKELLKKCVEDKYYENKSRENTLNNEKIKARLEKEYPQAKELTSQQISGAIRNIKKMKHKKHGVFTTLSSSSEAAIEQKAHKNEEKAELLKEDDIFLSSQLFESIESRIFFDKMIQEAETFLEHQERVCAAEPLGYLLA